MVTFEPRKWVWVPNQQTGIMERQRTPETIGFEHRLDSYLKTAEIIITLASASLVFAPKVLNLPEHPWFPFTVVMLGLSVGFGVAFMVALTYFYEGSLYNPESYTATKSGLVNALGFAALLSFGIAYIALAIQLATQPSIKTQKSITQTVSVKVMTVPHTSGDNPTAWFF